MAIRDVLTTRVPADLEDLIRQVCGERYVPNGVLPLDGGFDGHLIYAGDRSESVTYGVDRVRTPCTEEESLRWRAAADAYLQELADAYTELCTAQGATVRLGILLGLGSFTAARRPTHLPGWRRRVAAQSAAAQERFAERVAAALDRYQPTRNEIEQRRTQAHAEQREQQQRQEVWRQQLLEVARQPVWAYALGEDRVLHVYRVDVPPFPAGAEHFEQPLTAEELEDAVWQLRDRIRTIAWDPAACAQTERECTERDAYADFRTWWTWVTRRGWRIESHSDGHITHVSTHHSSHGIGDHTGFGHF